MNSVNCWLCACTHSCLQYGFFAIILVHHEQHEYSDSPSIGRADC
jgi:hypothetical protein